MNFSSIDQSQHNSAAREMFIVLLSYNLLKLSKLQVYADQRNISYLEALTRPPLSCYFYVLLTLLPQLYWFRLLVKGAFKTVSQYNNKPAADLNGTKNNNAEILKHD